MKRNLISNEERKKAEIQLQTSISHVIENGIEEPFVDFELSKYDGDIEPILVAICQAFRWGAKSILDRLEPEEKQKMVERLYQE